MKNCGFETIEINYKSMQKYKEKIKLQNASVERLKT